MILDYWWVAYIRWSIFVVEHMFGGACVVVQIPHLCLSPFIYAPVWWYWYEVELVCSCGFIVYLSYEGVSGICKGTLVSHVWWCRFITCAYNVPVWWYW